MPISLYPQFEGYSIGLYQTDEGLLWFDAQPITLLLGYPDSAQAIRQHCGPDNILAGTRQLPERVNLEGVYRLIFNAHTAQARRFAQWLDQSLLPQQYSQHLQPLRRQLAIQGKRLEVLVWQGNYWLEMRDVLALFASPSQRAPAN